MTHISSETRHEERGEPREMRARAEADPRIAELLTEFREAKAENDLGRATRVLRDLQEEAAGGPPLRKAQQMLLEALESPQVRHRRAAAIALRGVADPAIQEQLARHLDPEQEPDARCRKFSARALAGSTIPSIREALLQAFRVDDYIRPECAKSLRPIRSQEEIEAFATVLRNPTIGEWQFPLYLDCSVPSARALLLDVLQNKCVRFPARVACIRALSTNPDEKLHKILKTVIKEKNLEFDLKELAWEVLLKAAPHRAEAIVLKEAKRLRSFFKMALGSCAYTASAVLALKDRLDDRTIRNAVIALLDHPREDVFTSCVKVLTGRKEPEVVGALFKVFRGESGKGTPWSVQHLSRHGVWQAVKSSLDLSVVAYWLKDRRVDVGRALAKTEASEALDTLMAGVEAGSDNSGYDLIGHTLPAITARLAALLANTQSHEVAHASIIALRGQRDPAVQQLLLKELETGSGLEKEALLGLRGPFGRDEIRKLYPFLFGEAGSNGCRRLALRLLRESEDPVFLREVVAALQKPHLFCTSAMILAGRFKGQL